MNNDYKNIQPEKLFARNVPGIYEILKRKCVGIAGCGGLGSNAAVILARSGIGKLIVADFDTVAPENINRQHFFLDQIGMFKVDALGHILSRINPNLEYIPVKERITFENTGTIFADVDLLIEAFDLADQKRMLIESWVTTKNKKPIIAVSGVAGLEATGKINVRRMNNVFLIGDFITELDKGLIAHKVIMTAAAQVETAINLLWENDR